MRLLYYALGGGLGHLVRARAFLHTLGLGASSTVLMASPFADDPRVVGDLDVLRAPLELQADASLFRKWLQTELARRSVDVFCVDAFPAGILGELCDWPAGGTECWHVARLLRWDAYAELLSGPSPHFARCWRLEALMPDHQAFLDGHCERSEDLVLRDPPTEASSERAGIPTGEPFWLVVHSGPKSEVDELVEFARDTRALEGSAVAIHVASAHATADPADNVHAHDLHPASVLFARAQRIFSAAGFNIMRETAPHRARHRVLPMSRRFDDQHERARRAFAVDNSH